jgi:bacterioferritin-associated ferredoxin
VLVCHCLRVFDRTIRECVRAGACTADAVSERCGAGTGCGGCRESIEAIVEIVEREAARGTRSRLLAVIQPDELAA